MPQFYTGEVKTARVVLTNPKQIAVTYNGMLLMGAGLQLVGETSFSLSAGQSKEITFSATMPSVAGTYPVYLGVFYAGVLVQLFKASQDVMVALAGINPGLLQILSVEGRGFSEVGVGSAPYSHYGALASPIVVPNLSGVKIIWFNRGVIPSVFNFNASNDFERWNWWMSFEPQFDARYWVEDEYAIVGEPPNEYEELVNPAHWETPAFPTFMNRPIYTPTTFPPIGYPYEVSITGLHSGGRADIPGVYDGIFFFEQVYMDFVSTPAIYWRIKNLFQVTG